MALEVSSKELEIVKEHSKINFDIDYMLVTKVQGQFKEIQCAWKSDDEGN
jgi:polyisoprenoid-binding protein YceI